MTDKAELDRVRKIHRWLDNAHAEMMRAGRAEDQCGRGGYTAAEIRAWPELKRALIAMCGHYDWSAGDMASNVRGNGSGSLGSDYARECKDRGLCFYREMLADSEETYPNGLLNPEYQERVLAREANPEPKRADPYTGSDLVREKTIASVTDTTVGWKRVEAARLRNIAALRAEMARPAPVRFPHEGRSDRVYKANDR